MLLRRARQRSCRSKGLSVAKVGYLSLQAKVAQECRLCRPHSKQANVVTPLRRMCYSPLCPFIRCPQPLFHPMPSVAATLHHQHFSFVPIPSSTLCPTQPSLAQLNSHPAENRTLPAPAFLTSHTRISQPGCSASCSPI